MVIINKTAGMGVHGHLFKNNSERGLKADIPRSPLPFTEKVKSILPPLGPGLSLGHTMALPLCALVGLAEVRQDSLDNLGCWPR